MVDAHARAFRGFNANSNNCSPSSFSLCSSSLIALLNIENQLERHQAKNADLLTPWVSLWRLSFRDDAARTIAGRWSTPWPGDAAEDVPPPAWRLEFRDVRPPVRPWRLELSVT